MYKVHNANRTEKFMYGYLSAHSIISLGWCSIAASHNVIVGEGKLKWLSDETWRLLSKLYA